MTTFFPKPLDKQVAAISDSLLQTQDGLAIVANGNTHAAISSGQFVYVKGHDTLSEGLYKATSAIDANGTLSTSNLTPDGSGGLNDLQGQLTTLNSKITAKTYTATLSANNNVSPFLSLVSISIANDVANYGNVVSIVVAGGGTAAKPITTKLSSTKQTCYVYGMDVDSSVDVTITFMRT